MEYNFSAYMYMYGVSQGCSFSLLFPYFHYFSIFCLFSVISMRRTIRQPICTACLKALRFLYSFPIFTFFTVQITIFCLFSVISLRSTDWTPISTLYLKAVLRKLVSSCSVFSLMPSFQSLNEVIICLFLPFLMSLLKLAHAV